MPKDFDPTLFTERIHELRHQIETLETGLEQGAGKASLVRTLAECRGTLNRLLSQVTLPAEPDEEPGPTWKHGAARATKKQ